MTRMGTSMPVAEVFASALRGHVCLVLDENGDSGLLPSEVWLRDADHVDEALLDLCHGPTLDIGCGPGRMAGALARRGQVVLGIDVVPEAVRLSLGRGVATLLRDVFDPVPGEGRWETALLADGNIGIGGDPVALLERIRDLIAPTGRVVTWASSDGTTCRRTRALRRLCRLAVGVGDLPGDPGISSPRVRIGAPQSSPDEGMAEPGPDPEEWLETAEKQP